MKVQHTQTFVLVAIILFQIQCKLLIQSPPQLKTLLQTKYPDGIHYSVANYGDVPFGKSLSGTIYLSSYLQNCQYQDLDAEAQKNINKIVLSVRGDCTFTTKSLNSQKQGAKLAIIADNNQTQDPGSIVMVDDGKGSQVKIPTILINHEVGEFINDFILNKKKQVSLVVIFQTFKKPIVDVTLWLNSFDRKSYILIRQLEPYLSRIQNQTKLSVYHPTSYCKNCPQTDCFSEKDFCINTGFYGYMIEGYGQQIMKQQLRQEFIMKKYPHLWWKYLQEYDDQCDDRAQIFQCSWDSMKKVGINASQINKTVQESFAQRTYLDQNGTEKTTYDNKILEINNDMRYKSGIILFPGVIINNITYRGNLDALDVFQMICQSFETEPEGCDLSVKPPPSPSILKYVIIVAIIFVFIMAFLFFCYRRQARRQISKNLNNQVNQLVNQYITMYEAQRFQSNETPSSTAQAAQ